MARDLAAFDRQPWADRAACLGTDLKLFFPEVGNDGRKAAQQARAICAACPSAAECLEYALVNNIEHGTWGGATERDRRAIKRKRTRRQGEAA